MANRLNMHWVSESPATEGLPIIEHGGALFGYRTELVRFPEQKFSVIALCNLNNSNPRHLAYEVADLYLDGQYRNKTLPPAAHVNTQPFVGFYRNPANHSVVKVSERDGAIEIQQRRFQPVGGKRFSALVEEQQIGFEPANAGGMRMTMSSADAAAQVFERFQPVIPAAEDLAKYAGEYVSDELQASYKFAVNDGKLTLTRNWQERTVLEFNTNDEFRGPHDIAIVFRRDASGQIAGCDVFAGRVRNIALIRKP